MGKNPARDTQCDLFPREQHPDERTAKEFFADMEKKNFKRKFVEKVINEARVRYPNRKPIICLTTGEVFEGVNLAARKYDLANGNLNRHLKGDPQYNHCKGLKFQYI